jgi:hypothetical protein
MARKRRLTPNAETVAAMESTKFTFTGTVADFKAHLREIASAGGDAKHPNTIALRKATPPRVRNVGEK